MEADRVGQDGTKNDRCREKEAERQRELPWG